MPWRGASTEHHNICFCGEIRKISIDSGFVKVPYLLWYCFQTGKFLTVWSKKAQSVENGFFQIYFSSSQRRLVYRQVVKLKQQACNVPMFSVALRPLSAIWNCRDNILILYYIIYIYIYIYIYIILYIIIYIYIYILYIYIYIYIYFWESKAWHFI